MHLPAACIGSGGGEERNNMSRGEPLIRQWNLLKTIQANYFGVTADEWAQRV